MTPTPRNAFSVAAPPLLADFHRIRGVLAGASDAKWTEAQMAALSRDTLAHPAGLVDGTVKATQAGLLALGFPIAAVDGLLGPNTETSTADYQLARGGLSVDGIPGPHTIASIHNSLVVGGYLTKHFRFIEFRCGNSADDANVRYDTVRRLWVCRFCGGRVGVVNSQAVLMERYRVKLNEPVELLSAYRCPDRNATTAGSAVNSMHMAKRAGDVVPRLSIGAAQGLGFTGVGYNLSSGLAAHLDSRTSGTAVWPYSR